MIERLKRRWMAALLAAVLLVLLAADGGILAWMYHQCARESRWELAAALTLAGEGVLPTLGERGSQLSPAARWGMCWYWTWRRGSFPRWLILA